MSKEKPETPGIEDEEKLLEVDPEILKGASLSLVPSFETEVMAQELLEHLSNYHRALVGVKSARSSGDHAKADQLYRLMAYSRLAAAIIQSDHPGIKTIADEIGEVRAQQAKMQRAALLVSD